MRISRPRDAWFPCPDDPDGGKVLIKYLLPGERQKIFDATMPQKIESESGEDGKLKPLLLLHPDRETDREMTLKACVVDWENFFDEKGEPLECTHENIMRAADEIEGFVEFVTECRLTLESDIMLGQKEQEKNSSSSASE